MLAIDKETGLNRGFSLVQRLDSLFKADSQLMFKPSEYFRYDNGLWNDNWVLFYKWIPDVSL